MVGRRILSLMAVTACATVLVSCTAEQPVKPGAGPTGELRIFAAASLKSAFDELSGEFERIDAGVDILPIVYDGSSTLATQLLEGAAADVFASADEKNMAKVVAAGLGDAPALFATNTLVIAVPAGNPGGIAGLDSLADPARTVVLCAPEVPCGAAAQRLLAAQGVAVTPVSLEQNVTAVLTKVAIGEADAGLVYATDVRGRDDVASIVPVGASVVVNSYPIVALSESRNPALAQAFVDFVRGPVGQQVLASHGFGAP